MAVTYAVSDLNVAPPRQPGSAGDKRIASKLLTATGTYTTGGDAVTAASLGLTRIHYAHVSLHTTADAVESIIAIPQSNGSVLLKQLVTAGAENGNGDTVTGLICQIIAWGDA